MWFGVTEARSSRIRCFSGRTTRWKRHSQTSNLQYFVEKVWS